MREGATAGRLVGLNDVDVDIGLDPSILEGLFGLRLFSCGKENEYDVTYHRDANMAGP